MYKSLFLKDFDGSPPVNPSFQKIRGRGVPVLGFSSDLEFDFAELAFCLFDRRIVANRRTHTLRSLTSDAIKGARGRITFTLYAFANRTRSSQKIINTTGRKLRK